MGFNPGIQNSLNFLKSDNVIYHVNKLKTENPYDHLDKIFLEFNTL
jgi:hypothetical protein